VTTTRCDRKIVGVKTTTTRCDRKMVRVETTTIDGERTRMIVVVVIMMYFLKLKTKFTKYFLLVLIINVKLF